MTVVVVAFRNLAAWHPRNLGALAGIMIAVASFVALVSLARGVEDTLLSALETRGTDVVITEAGALDLMSSIIPDSLAAEVSAIPGVAGAAPEITRLTTLNDGRSIAVVAWPPGTFPWESLDVTAGRLPQAGDTQVVVLGEGLADRTGLSVDDTLQIFFSEFEVVGIVTAPAVLTRNLAYVPLADVQALTFREGQATSINVRLEADGREQTLTSLRARFPDLSVEETQVLADNYLFGRIAAALALTISTAALASAALVIFNTMSTAVNARRGEIAILSAIGWARRRIITMLLIEGVVIAVAAGLAGAFLGVIAAHLVAARPAIEGFVAPVIGLPLLLEAFVLSVAVGLVGSLVPAVRAASRPPAEVLRGR